MKPYELIALRELINRVYERDSCAVSVRATLDYMEAIGESGKPMAVELGVIDTSTKKVVDIGIGNPNPEYIGHVVVITDTHLIDPSLDQVNRDGISITLGASMFPWNTTPEDWKHDNRGIFLNHGGPANWYAGPVLVRYMARPMDKRYTTSPNWGKRDRSIRQKIVAEVLRNRDTLLEYQRQADEAATKIR